MSVYIQTGTIFDSVRAGPIMTSSFETLDVDCLAHVLHYLPTCRPRAKLVIASGEGVFAQRVLTSNANQTLWVYLIDKASSYYLRLLRKVALIHQKQYHLIKHLNVDYSASSELSVTPQRLQKAYKANAPKILVDILNCHVNHLESLYLYFGHYNFNEWAHVLTRFKEDACYSYMSRLKRLHLVCDSITMGEFQQWLNIYWQLLPADKLESLDIYIKDVKPSATANHLCLPYMPSLRTLELDIPGQHVKMICPDTPSTMQHLTQLVLLNSTWFEFLRDDASNSKFLPSAMKLVYVGLSSQKPMNMTPSVITWFIHRVEDIAKHWAERPVDRHKDLFVTYAAKLETRDSQYYDFDNYQHVTSLEFMHSNMRVMSHYIIMMRILKSAANLTTLDYYGCSFASCGPTIASLLNYISPTLTELTLGNVKGMNVDLSACLRRLIHLRRLDLSHVPIEIYEGSGNGCILRQHESDDDHWAFLATNALPTSLTFLDMSHHNFKTTYNFVDPEQQVWLLCDLLKPLSNLETLRLDGMSNRHRIGWLLPSLSCQSTLQSLSLRDSSVWWADAQVAYFAAFKALKVLDMGGSNGMWRADMAGNKMVIDATLLTDLDECVGKLWTLKLPALPALVTNPKTPTRYFLSEDCFVHLRHTMIQFSNCDVIRISDDLELILKTP